MPSGKRIARFMQGKLICIASVLSEKGMSAIIRAYTLDGFVVFADGRSTPVDPNKPVNDETQKIFNVSSVCGPLSMAIVGTSDIDTIDGLHINLVKEFRNSADVLREAIVADLDGYATILSGPVHALVKQHSTNMGAMGNSDLLNVFVDGFFNGIARTVRIRFFYQNGVFAETEITFPDICWQPYIHGADNLATSMFIGNGMIPRTYSGPAGPIMSTHAVTGMACAYIHACCEQHNIEAEPFCATIGGHIHGAIVGPGGFRWIDGFRPVGM